MILKTAANYNDEGGYIEAWKKSDGTTEVKLIPKSGGGDEGKNGILSVTISPAITTTPALDSMFPIYWEDLTEEQKEGIQLVLNSSVELVDTDTYTITVTPTEEWYASNTNSGIKGGKGEPITFEEHPNHGELFVPCAASIEQDTEEANTVFVDILIVANH